MAHKHAKLMEMYAKDACESDTPWERWEFRVKGTPHVWCKVHTHPTWQLDVEYRRRKATHIVNGIEVPAPLTDIEGIEFWYFDCSKFDNVCSTVGPQHNLEVWQSLLKAGLLFETKEDAKKNFDAHFLQQK